MSEIWPNGIHPQQGIQTIRDALALVSQDQQP